jgi:hypothetical protein
MTTATNIDYVLLPELGGLRHARKDSPNTGWRNKSFSDYADYMQTEDFQKGLQALIRMSRQNVLRSCAPRRCPGAATVLWWPMRSLRQASITG